MRGCRRRGLLSGARPALGPCQCRQRSRLSVSLYAAVGAGQGREGHYDSTWTRVTGVPKQVILALSSEDGNSGECAGKRGGAWRDVDHQGKKGTQGLTDHMEDTVCPLTWTGNWQGVGKGFEKDHVRLCYGENGPKWMERTHGGVDELLAVWGVGVLERSLGGRICRSW